MGCAARTMDTQAMLWMAAGLCAACAIGAAWGEARRKRRRDPDKVGLMDWRTVQLGAIAGTILLAALALKNG